MTWVMEILKIYLEQFLLKKKLQSSFIKVNLIKKTRFYYVLLIFIVNVLGLFLWKIKKALRLLMLFNRF